LPGTTTTPSHGTGEFGCWPRRCRAGPATGVSTGGLARLKVFNHRAGAAGGGCRGEPDGGRCQRTSHVLGAKGLSLVGPRAGPQNARKGAGRRSSQPTPRRCSAGGEVAQPRAPPGRSVHSGCSWPGDGCRRKDVATWSRERWCSDAVQPRTRGGVGTPKGGPQIAGTLQQRPGGHRAAKRGLSRNRIKNVLAPRVIPGPAR